MSESAVSAKRFCFMFGAKPAQSETPVRAAAKRRPPGRGAVEGRRAANNFRWTGPEREVLFYLEMGSAVGGGLNVRKFPETGSFPKRAFDRLILCEDAAQKLL